MKKEIRSTEPKIFFPHKKKTKAERRQFYLKLFAVLAGSLFIAPLVITVLSSFMSQNEIAMSYSTSLSVFDMLDGIKKKFISVKLIPDKVTLEQYKKVLISGPAFMQGLVNSLKIALPVTLGNLLISIPAAYGFTVWENRHKEKVFALFVTVMLMPLQAVLVPNFIVIDALGLRNTLWAIILPGIFSPFGVFLMRQNMKAIPPAYIEAAKIDGAGHLKIFTKIVLPQLWSAIAALAMLVFIEYWNIVEQAVIFITDYSKEPLSVYLSRMSADSVGIIFSAGTVYMFLPLWFLFTQQENLEKGIELSGVK